MKSLWERSTTIINEYWYGLIYPLVALVSLFYHPKRHHSSTATEVPIILVFCWFTPNSAHNKWVAYLEQKGYLTYLLNLPLLHEDFQKTAKRLEIFISEHKFKNYTLVGISTGALVCLYFLSVNKKWKEIHRFINIGGPLHGTPTARFIRFTGKGKDMLPGSKFIKGLHRQYISPEKIATVTATYDELVPRRYSRIVGNTTYVLPVWGHNRLHMGNKPTYDLVAQLAKKN